MIKVTGSLQKSTEIMKLSNALIKLPQISQTMREMSMEMTKVCRCPCWGVAARLTPRQAGIMDEMLEDTLNMDEDEELEDEADAEVDKVLAELTDGKLGQAGSVGTDLPVSDGCCSSGPLRSMCCRYRTRWKTTRRRRRWRSIGSS
ncbi:hypothetical protein B0H17DRAFT_292010 [Mycena rosella]|uniref:Charged multivesicular body protein 3 n=1 Tax=Mycena rosella TaxID=1033263 RepID=A0AAD7CV21_MYCRO|nr:hypothetical protein B0H17DRAFT_292010 [Mycena rosella]